MRIVVLNNNREIRLTDDKADQLEELLSSGRAKGMVKLNDQFVRISSIKHVYRSGADPSYDMPYEEKVRQQFYFEEQSYRRQTAQQKAEREYYSRFMHLVLSAFGIKKVFGEDYHSPMLDIPFDSYEAHENFKFTPEQIKDRRRRLNEFVKGQGKEQEWGAELKKFFLDYFNQNPQSTWCPVDLWLPVLDIPTSLMERIVIRHDSLVNPRE
jgi:hypothetical protein